MIRVGYLLAAWETLYVPGRQTDCSGNTTTVSQVITLVDNSPPILTIPADSIVDCTSIPAASAADATALDNCSNPSVTYDGELIVGNGCPYEIHRTWTANRCLRQYFQPGSDHHRTRYSSACFLSILRRA